MKTPIVILHGWGKEVSGTRFATLKRLLEKKGYPVFTPDLPGFGTNQDIAKDYVFEDYVAFAKQYVEGVAEKEKSKKVILVGHSFGGRIAIRFTAENNGLVEKLILTGASGIPRSLPSLKKKIVYRLTKILGPLFAAPPFSLFYTLFRKVVYYSIGEMDYYKADNLRTTFKNVYLVSIEKDLPNVKVATLLVWGANDTLTPLKDGKLMNEKIRQSKLIVVADATHRLPYEMPEIFAEKIEGFLA